MVAQVPGASSELPLAVPCAVQWPRRLATTVLAQLGRRNDALWAMPVLRASAPTCRMVAEALAAATDHTLPSGPQAAGRFGGLARSGARIFAERGTGSIRGRLRSWAMRRPSHTSTACLWRGATQLSRDRYRFEPEGLFAGVLRSMNENKIAWIYAALLLGIALAASRICLGKAFFDVPASLP